MRMVVSAFCLLVAGCNPVGPGKELSDGCYYLSQHPVLRVKRDQGEVLIAGDVRTIAIETAKTKSVSQAIFSPGFDVVKGPPLLAKLNPKFPKTYYMMNPFSSVPTISMYTDTDQPIELSLGPDC